MTSFPKFIYQHDTKLFTRPYIRRFTSLVHHKTYSPGFRPSLIRKSILVLDNAKANVQATFHFMNLLTPLKGAPPG